MNFRDFLGGSIIGVLLKLAILSLIVGIVLTVFGVTPHNFFYVIDDVFRSIYDFVYAWSDWILGYMALGAMLVVPIWFILRLLRARDSRRSADDDRL